MDISFRLFEPNDIDAVSGFLLPRKLDYKGYGVWLQKALEELRWGAKESVLGFSEGVLVSNLIFQDCRHLRGFCELKSGRTIEKFLGRLFLSFETRQVEALAKEEKNLGMICDVRSNRLDVLNLYKSMGYREVARTDLYKEEKIDVVLMKPLVKNFPFNFN